MFAYTQLLRHTSRVVRCVVAGGYGDQMTQPQINRRNKLTVGSVFSGIGGFDLGLERAGMEVIWQIEIDPFRRRMMIADKNYV